MYIDTVPYAMKVWCVNGKFCKNLRASFKCYFLKKKMALKEYSNYINYK